MIQMKEKTNKQISNGKTKNILNRNWISFFAIMFETLINSLDMSFDQNHQQFKPKRRF